MFNQCVETVAGNKSHHVLLSCGVFARVDQLDGVRMVELFKDGDFTRKADMEI